MLVCRVVPDLPAVERIFDYLVPDALAPQAVAGAIVRVPLHGRRVRGWVVASGVEPAAAPDRLRPLIEFVSFGPPEAVVSLTEWAAWRWSGPRTAFLRAASPPNRVRGLPPQSPPRPPASGAGDPEAVALTVDARAAGRATVRWPPARDPYDLVAELAAGSGSTIVVAPRAAAAIHLARRLGRAGRRVVLMRASDSGSARTRAWVQAAGGGCIVIGGRIAAWAPVPDLAAVVVLDDADEALQEERAPTWHGRDVALERAGRAGAPAVVISPAPTPDATVAAAAHLAPSRIVERDGWPVTEVVDRRGEAPGLGLFSERLVAALRETTERGQRSVCVLNRKGRARLLACDACGELARCETCGAAVGEVDDTLTCPRCGLARPRVCAACGATRLKVLRAGVARVRDDLAALLVRVDVAEIEASTPELADVPVLVGTEAVLHRIDTAGLVAFLDFDQELLAPRFRAAEQALWLLVRAARIVGSRRGGGRIVVQTRVPRHEVLDAAVRADPALVTGAEDERRRLLQLPPYGGLAAVSGDEKALTFLRDGLAGQLGVDVGGDDRRLVIRAPSAAALATALAGALPAGRSAGRLRVEVDPPRL